MADLFVTRTFPETTRVRPFTTRFEPNPVSGDPATGLMAQVWDPLWLLGRQWQFGEFAGEDTGTPLTVEVTAEFDPLVAWHPGPLGDEPAWCPLAPGDLLEPLVEAEPDAARGGRFAAAAAWALQDALAALGASAAVDALVEQCGATPGAWSGPQSILADRALDAGGVAAAFAHGHPAWFTTALPSAPAPRQQATAAMDEWLEWYTREAAPPSTPSSWLGDRLEYEFSVATTRAVLRAPAYGGGEIGWSTFDLEPTAPAPPSDRTPEPITQQLLASQLTFPGMPSSRFWEFEDAALDLGSVWADPDELARLLVVEAAIVSGDDWLVLPVDSPPGGVLRVTGVAWRDTFGGVTVAEERPAPIPLGRRVAPWRVFTTTEALREGDRASLTLPGVRQEVAGLFVPPSSATALEAPVVEDVRFQRDETTNLVWAIEQTVPSAGSGDPLPLTSEPRPRPDAIDPGGQPADQVLGYELMTFVPQTWHPYLARIGEAGVVLERARLLGGARPGPQGVLLSEEAQRIIRTAEVPRQGVRVQRLARAARRPDGSWAMWLGRRVRPGHGEAESGLEFDRTRKPTGSN
ncbi:MAG: hypothetical protein QM708_14055 [Propioniciclava sp.]|uniref:hypothetical protein n=1 Tax=Propioniciclava sp. TaxID=2038686 RepID=UPI0039E6F16B